MTVPTPWHNAFVAFRLNADHLGPESAKAFAAKLTADDWAWVDEQKARWVNVTNKSNVARASLAVAEALEPYRADS